MSEAPYVQVAEIEIDPGRLDEYKAAVGAQVEAAVRDEPGVLLLYAVASKEMPTRFTVFEVYRDANAYRAHLQAPHFLKYKVTVETMVTSLKLVPADLVAMGSKADW